MVKTLDFTLSEMEVLGTVLEPGEYFSARPLWSPTDISGALHGLQGYAN